MHNSNPYPNPNPTPTPTLCLTIDLHCYHTFFEKKVKAIFLSEGLMKAVYTTERDAATVGGGGRHGRARHSDLEPTTDKQF